MSDPEFSEILSDSAADSAFKRACEIQRGLELEYDTNPTVHFHLTQYVHGAYATKEQAYVMLIKHLLQIQKELVAAQPVGRG